MAKPPKFSTRERALMGLTAFALIFAYTKFWYLAKRRELNLAQSKISTLRSDIARKRTIIAAIQSRKLASDQNPVSMADRSLADLNAKMSSLVKEVAEGSSPSHFKIERISLDGQKKDKAFLISTFSVDVVTTFPRLGQFLEDLEASDLLARVENVRISKPKDDLQQIDAELKILSYQVVKDE